MKKIYSNNKSSILLKKAFKKAILPNNTNFKSNIFEENENIFAQSHEEMILIYNELANEYRELLKQKELIENEKKITISKLASINKKDQKLNYLIDKVKKEKK